MLNSEFGPLAARRNGTSGGADGDGCMKARILKRLEDEANGLERELRTELPKEIQRARELGDLSENAEYQAAKERQTFVHARVAMLRKRMAEIR